jgi:hypothetical protein
LKLRYDIDILEQEISDLKSDEPTPTAQSLDNSDSFFTWNYCHNIYKNDLAKLELNLARYNIELHYLYYRIGVCNKKFAETKL